MPLGIGGFGSDGVFQDAGRKISDGGKIEKEALKTHSELLDRNIEPSAVKAPFSFHQDLEPVQRIIHGDISNQKMVQDTPLVLHDSRPDIYSRGASMLPRIPPFNFTPQSWLYRDPTANLQGIFC